MGDVERYLYIPISNHKGELALRPILPVILSHNDYSINMSGLVDSGADVNVLPYDMGLRLGAVWSEQRVLLELSGNLAKYEARGIILTVMIGSLLPVRLAFAWTRAENVPLILGQVNFFAEFDVCFFRSESAFEVQPKGSKSLSRSGI